MNGSGSTATRSGGARDAGGGGPAAAGGVHVELAPRRVARLLAGLVLALILAHVAGAVLKHRFGRDWVFGMVPAFNLDGEGNVPTWVAAVGLLVCALLLALIAAGRRAAADPFARHWSVLAAGFAFLSLDEAAQLHELLAAPLRARLGTGDPGAGGWLYDAWVIPYALVAAAVAVAYLRFLAALPARTRRLFVAAGACYLTGAVLMEVVSRPAQALAAAHPTLAYHASVLSQEAGELAGIAIFLYALIAYLAGGAAVVRIAAGPRGTGAPRPEPGRVGRDAGSDG